MTNPIFDFETQYKKAIFSLSEAVKEAIGKSEAEIGKTFSDKEKELYALFSLMYLFDNL